MTEHSCSSEERLKKIWTDTDLAFYIVKQARRHFRSTADRDIAVCAAWDRLEREALKSSANDHARRIAYNAIHALYLRQQRARVRAGMCTRMCTYPPKNVHG